VEPHGSASGSTLESTTRYGDRPLPGKLYRPRE